MEASAEVVVIPWPVMGHVQIVEFAKLIKHHLPPGKSVTVTVLIMKLPDYIDTVTKSYVDLLRASSSGTGVDFLELPQTKPGPDWSSRTPGSFIHSLVLSQRTNVADFLRSRCTNVAAVVVDMLSTSMIHVAEEFHIPAYVFYPSPASFLGAVLHCQTLHDDHNQDVSELRNSQSKLLIPSYAEPVPPDVLSQVLVNKLPWQSRFLHHARDYRKAKGIIINTFNDLEPYALDSFSASGPRIPPVYPVGPILNQGPMIDFGNSRGAESLKWLDDQPSESVVVVCFGSEGSLSEAQIKEVAVGLERSGHRFLWALRRQSPEGQKASLPSEYTSFKEVLPEGFLERTSGLGKVTGWIPQLRVLSHASVGGFVSHCGWNSVLESLWCGVPIATWPLYAEQHMNAFQLVGELGLAVELTLKYHERSGDAVAVVAAEEVERGVREVMEVGSEVRKRVKDMKEKSRLSVVEGGSSYISFNRLINDIISNV